jgi:hypothetical protein
LTERRRSSECLEVRPDENFDGLFAGADLHADTRIAKVDLVASSNSFLE